jgi:predicted DNA-binding transcriptional regulator AlpA
MNETATTLESALEGLLRRIIREEIRALKADLNGQEDRLMDAEEASKLLGMSRHWLYRHGKKLPFTRKLGPKNLRFSYQGIQKYLATRKIP